MLLLDEPATGLDARLERRLMELLRELADDDRAVVVATHATASLALCDDIAVMGPDGRLRFWGSPAALLEHFGVARLRAGLRGARRPTPPDARDRWPATAGRVVRARARRSRPSAWRRWPSQAVILASRYARVAHRDRRTLALLVGQAPVIGAAIGLVLPQRGPQRAGDRRLLRRHARATC